MCMRWLGGSESKAEGLKAEHINKENYPKKEIGTPPKKWNHEESEIERGKKSFSWFDLFQNNRISCEMLRDHECCAAFFHNPHAYMCLCFFLFVHLLPASSAKSCFSYASATSERGTFVITFLDRFFSFWDDSHGIAQPQLKGNLNSLASLFGSIQISISTLRKQQLL